MGKYRFNKEQLRFVEEKIGLKGWIKRAVKYFVVSVLLAILYYFVISLFVNTEQERSLSRETKLMEEEYEKLQGKVVVLDNTVKNLQQKDREIYRSIFNANPPALSNSSKDGIEFFEAIDTTKNDAVVKDSKIRISVVEKGVEGVNETIKSITEDLQALKGNVRSIPSIIPIRDFTIRQTGASVGKKINPFYKTVSAHNGIDLLGANGVDVFAAADGVVSDVSRKGKKEGNMVVINHNNGYVTKYMTLGDVLVRQGQKVNQGMVIGRIGSTGMTFAPHLHYEVWFNGSVMDPVNYFFADLTPSLFKEMVIVAANTGQSLD